MSLATASRCGAPSSSIGETDSVAQNGLDWIYVDYRQVSAELVRYAHQRGLRVAVFTVNDLREIARLNGEWPDAVITDRDSEHD